ncbi:hypothetical protein BS78_10G098800 [Paspalum vaginatum]|nr:hypothetical protein BS78_10G098800 [Paspalum vaginatum]
MDAGGGAVAASGGLDDADAAFFSRRGHRCCGCFWAPPWAPASPHARRATGEEWWHRVGAAESGRRRWWRRGVDALMKVREWSELVAGPRWKTFIRRFRRSSPRHGAAGGGGGKLNYDPLSYALNFDDGGGGGGGSPDGGDYAGFRDFSARFVAPPGSSKTPDGGDYAGFRDFSARFVAPPGSSKTSMDLGGPPLLLHHHPHSPRPPPTAAARA